jgi:hypothetical protein
VLSSSVVDREFQSRSGQIKDCKIYICCFSSKNAVFRSKSKDWLPRNQNKASEWSYMSTCWICFSELAKCGVIWLSELRGEYLDVNVLRGTTADGRTDDKLWQMNTWPLVSWAKQIIISLLIYLTEEFLIVTSNQMSDML